MANTHLGAESAQVTYIAVSRACRIHGIPHTTFGRRAVGDPRFVQDMRNGRCLRPATAARVLRFIAELGER
jgi:hypothetical protein